MVMQSTLSQELMELDKKHFIHPTTSISQQQANGPAYIFTEGKGVYLKDVNGQTFIDGMSSLWNVNIGHGREEIGEVAKAQMSKLAFTSSFSTYSNEPAIRLATKIASLAPSNLNAVFFTSGGSEANETAFKLARHYWMLKGQHNRKIVISRKQSYHGVAIGSTSATGLKPFRDFTNSNAPDFYHVDAMSTEALRQAIEELGPENVAAFITEPVQGAGGVHIAPEGYFQEVRDLCDEYGLLLIADEVITGFGRTGTFFAMEHFDVEPDLLCFAKGVTSGYAQLGGVMVSDAIHQDLIALSKDTLLHGYTYSGHAMACAVGLKNIEIVERENLVANAKVMGEELLRGFEKLHHKHRIVGHVRTLGLIGGIQLVKDNRTGEGFATPLAPRVVAEAAKRGLITRPVTFDQDTLVFAPPLVITKDEIDQLITILDETLQAITDEIQ